MCINTIDLYSYEAVSSIIIFYKRGIEKFKKFTEVHTAKM